MSLSSGKVKNSFGGDVVTFLIVLFVSFGFMFLFHLLVVALFELIRPFLKKHPVLYSLVAKKKTLLTFILSLSFLVVFYFFFTLSAYLLDKPDFLEGELYATFQTVGFVAVLWCYLRWDLHYRAFPYLDTNCSSFFCTTKKMAAFGFIFVFTICYDSSQFSKFMGGTEIDPMLVTINAIMLPSMLALERFLNQVCSFLRMKEENKNIG